MATLPPKTEQDKALDARYPGADYHNGVDVAQIFGNVGQCEVCNAATAYHDAHPEDDAFTTGWLAISNRDMAGTIAALSSSNAILVAYALYGVRFQLQQNEGILPTGNGGGSHAWGNALSDAQYASATGRPKRGEPWWRAQREMQALAAPNRTIDASGSLRSTSLGTVLLADVYGAASDSLMPFGETAGELAWRKASTGQTALPAGSVAAAAAAVAATSPNVAAMPSGWRVGTLEGASGYWGPDGLFHAGTTPWRDYTPGVGRSISPPAPASVPATPQNPAKVQSDSLPTLNASDAVTLNRGTTSTAELVPLYRPMPVLTADPHGPAAPGLTDTAVPVGGAIVTDTAAATAPSIPKWLWWLAGALLLGKLL